MLKRLISRFRPPPKKDKKYLLYYYISSLAFIVIVLFLALLFERPAALEISDFGFIRKFTLGEEAVEVELSPQNPQVGEETSLVFALGGKTESAEAFLIHESLLDFIYLPLEGENGVFSGKITPLKEGRYLGWVSYGGSAGSPSGSGKTRTFSFEFDTFQSYSYVPKDPSRSGIFAGASVELSYPETLEARKKADFSVTTSLNGDEEVPAEYLGGFGQVVLVREDGKNFARLPLEKKDNQLLFSYSFPSSGFYKLWIQYKAEGSEQVITASFGVEVN